MGRYTKNTLDLKQTKKEKRSWQTRQALACSPENTAFLASLSESWKARLGKDRPSPDSWLGLGQQPVMRTPPDLCGTWELWASAHGAQVACSGLFLPPSRWHPTSLLLLLSVPAPPCKALVQARSSHIICRLWSKMKM